MFQKILDGVLISVTDIFSWMTVLGHVKGILHSRLRVASLCLLTEIWGNSMGILHYVVLVVEEILPIEKRYWVVALGNGL
jgi:hypothetical protein